MEEILQTCKNCGNTLNGNYCSDCGQKANTGRINFRSFAYSLSRSVFHVDKGLLYTIKELAIRPGKMIRGYLAGKRVNYFAPFAFVIITAAVYTLVFRLLGDTPKVQVVSDSADHQEKIMRLNDVIATIMTDHYALAMLCLLPFFSLSTFLFFKKSGFNFWEHLVINSYISGMGVIIDTVMTFPYIWLGRPAYISGITLLAIVLYNIWMLILVFGERSKAIAAVKAVFSFLAYYIILMAIIATIGIVYLYMN